MPNLARSSAWVSGMFVASACWSSSATLAGTGWTRKVQGQSRVRRERFMPASYANHRAQLKAILLGWGMPEENAETTSDVLSWADLHGVASPGIANIRGYDGLPK